MSCLIDESTQREIAERIDQAVAEVLSEIPNHGSEEGVTPVFGHALMRQSFHSAGLSVEFNYRQLNKQTEEPYAGADGGFLVRVTNADGTTKKAALFQAKLLKGARPVRQLTMRTTDAQRLKDQAGEMLGHTEEAVAIFYTEREIYVVDAEHYRASTVREAQTPLSQKQRLITLGTYLGRWLPRCTRGDHSPDLASRIEHQNGFKQDFTMDVITKQPPIPWKKDPAAILWRKRRS